MNIEIDYNPETDHFEIRGKLNVAAIGDWVGWQRRGPLLYSAPGWASSALAVKPPATAKLAWTARAAQRRDALLKALNDARGYLSGGSLPRGDWPTERRPDKHQEQAVAAIASMDYRVQLKDDMGLGKTSTALWAFARSKVQRLLVVCPASAKFNWQREINATLGDVCTFVIDGDKDKRARMFEDVFSLKHEPDGMRAVIINYDLLRHLTDEQFGDLMAFTTRGFIVFDECHYLADEDSQRSKSSRTLAEHAAGVLGLSGTPIRNLADDLYSQLTMIRPGLWTSMRDFSKRYLVKRVMKAGKRKITKVVAVKNLDELNAVVNTMSFGRHKTDVLNLPPKIRTFPELELDGGHLKFYKAMKDFARVELSQLGGDLSIWDPRARSAIEQAMRCEQIAQGFIGGIPDPVMQKLDPEVLRSAEKIEGRPNELVFPGSVKISWIIEAAETLLAQSGSVAIASRFNAPMFWLERYFALRKVSARVLHGGLEAKVKDQFVVDFQAKCFDVLIFQVKIAEAWSAVRAQDVLFLGRDWSPAVNAQAEDRFYRRGQKGTVNVQIPIVTNTIERMIDRRLREKTADAEQALRTVTVAELIEAL